MRLSLSLSLCVCVCVCCVLCMCFSIVSGEQRDMHGGGVSASCPHLADVIVIELVVAQSNVHVQRVACFALRQLALVDVDRLLIVIAQIVDRC